MSARRWEKERAAWLLARSRPGTSLRRRAELMRRVSRRDQRSQSGVAETGLHEDVTEPLFRRMLATDEGSTEKMARLVMVPAIFIVIGLVIGPAMLVAKAIYAVLWHFSPGIGRLWNWPWFAGGVVSMVVGGWIVSAVVTEPVMWAESWPPELHVYLPVFGPLWFWAQTTLGLLLTGLHIWRSGWQAVKPKSSRSKVAVKKNKDGSFKRIEDKDLVDLVPYATPSATKEPEVVEIEVPGDSPDDSDEAAEAEPVYGEDDLEDWGPEDIELIEINDFEEKEKSND